MSLAPAALLSMPKGATHASSQVLYRQPPVPGHRGGCHRTAEAARTIRATAPARLSVPKDKLKFVQVRHEEQAAFMACAHAKWTGWVLAEEERLSGEKPGEAAIRPAREAIRRIFGV